MFAIYKNTMIKYLKSPSTWIIVIISMIISSVVGVFLPLNSFDTNHQYAIDRYIASSIKIVAFTTIFSAIFASVFAGFKSSTMFKDEVENGFFLTLLSKPIEKNIILFSKWLALQTLMFFYSLFTIMSFLIAIIILDVGQSIPGLDKVGVTPLIDKIWIISLYMFLILLLVCLIFSSLSLIISTKFSVATTIGVSIGVGILIQISSLIGIFVKEETYSSTLDANSFKRQQFLNEKKNEAKIFLNNDEINVYKKMQNSLEKNMNQYKKFVNSKESIYNIALNLNEENLYKDIWFFDLNFQMNLISQYAYEQVIPLKSRALISKHEQGIKTEFSQKIKNEEFNQSINKNFSLRKKIFDKKILKTLNEYEKIRKEFFKMWFFIIEKNFLRFNKLNNLINKDKRIIKILYPKRENDKTFFNQIDPQTILDYKVIKKQETGFFIREQIYYYEIPISDYIKVLNHYKKELFVNNDFTILKPNIKINKILAPKKKQGQNYVDQFDFIRFLSTFNSYWGMKAFSNELYQNIFKINKFSFLNENLFMNSLELDIIRGIEAIIPISNIINVDSKSTNKSSIYSLVDTNKELFKNNQSKIGTYEIKDDNNNDPYYLNFHEKETYEYLIGFLNKNNQNIHKIEQKEYVKKEYVLIFYITFGFVILPLVYFIIKRQDFK